MNKNEKYLIDAMDVEEVKEELQQIGAFNIVTQYDSDLTFEINTNDKEELVKWLQLNDYLTDETLDFYKVI